MVPLTLHQSTHEPADPSFPSALQSPLSNGGQTTKSLDARIAALKTRQDMIDGMLLELSSGQGRAGGGSVRWRGSASAATPQAPQQQPPQQQQQQQFAKAPKASQQQQEEETAVALAAARAAALSSSSSSKRKKRALGTGKPTHEVHTEPLPCSLNESIRVDRTVAKRLGVYVYERETERCALSAISHKMEPGCRGEGNRVGKKLKPEMQRQLLVVGVQRSGTHYAWEMYNRLGVHVHHEGLGPDGAVSWFFAYKTTGYAINNPTALHDHSFCFVFHQVRHPMRVVSSIVKASRKNWDTYWEWVTKTDEKVCGPSMRCKKMPLLKRSARQWLVWNRHIEEYADLRFRVEDTSPRAVCRLAMFDEYICGSQGEYHTTSSKVIQPVVEPQAPADNHTGTDHLKASWEEIQAMDADLAAEMKEMTRRYGYHLDPAMHPQSLSTAVFRAGGVEKKQKQNQGELATKGAKAEEAAQMSKAIKKLRGKTAKKRGRGGGGGAGGGTSGGSLW